MASCYWCRYNSSTMCLQLSVAVMMHSSTSYEIDYYAVKVVHLDRKVDKTII